MRIIAGEHRGRRIAAPKGLATRPMLDRVREACFSTLGDRVPEARVLDLFSGSGSLGLEALSRGARFARLVEHSRGAVRLLRKNVDELGVGARADVVKADALSPAAWGEEDERFELIFLDPPYAQAEAEPGRGALIEALRKLGGERLLPDGLIVLHTPLTSPVPEDLTGFDADRRVYGKSALWYLQPEGPA